MNATRAVTICFRRAGAPREAKPPVYSIGRVQTPTLAIVVRREQAIRAFQPRDYWEVRGTFATRGRRRPTAPTRSRRSGRRVADARKRSATRFGERALADQVAERAGAHAAATHPAGPVVERLTQKESREPPPLLFDLTSLQRTANRRFGLSATRTLEAAQALYERHKILTYPRTDSRHLPEDLAGELPKLFSGLAKLARVRAVRAAAAGRAAGRPARARRIFDDAKVHDHHAIIPTGKVRISTRCRRTSGASSISWRAGSWACFTPTPSSRSPRRSCAWARRTAPTRRRARGSPEDAFIAALPAPPDRFVARGRVRLVAGWQAVAGLDKKSGGGGARDKATDDASPSARRPGAAAAADRGTAPGRALRGARPPDAAAAAAHRGHVAGGDGVRGPRDRGRGAARRDEGHGPRHAGDARGDDRDAAQAQVHRARGQAGGRDADGHRAHRAAAGGEPGVARADRRVGGAAGAHRARSGDARGVHGRHRALRRAR